MITKTLDVKGMSCGHCVQAVETSVKELGGIQSVKVDLTSNKVTVSFDEAEVELAKIKEAVEEAGYEVQ
jgi:copper chaperone